MPHGIDQIAAVCGLQLQSDLAPQFAGRQGFAPLTPEILEANLSSLIRRICCGGLNNRS
jgi:hypothetical protein